MEIAFPQKHLLEGELPFNLRFKDSSERIDLWFLSTLVPVPEVIFLDGGTLQPFYWDTSEIPKWIPRYEFLVGTYIQSEKHGSIHKTWGTQPLNTYLRGHFCLKPHPRACEVGEHILVQQYFKSGWWGDGAKIIIQEQLKQNSVALPLLWKLGVFKSGVNVHFFDQSKPVSETFGLEYALLKAETLPASYYKYLSEYLKTWRSNDFLIPINEVMKKHVNPNLP
jgi:hypothetical protein